MALAAAVLLGGLLSCQSFRPMPATDVVPGTWVRVAAPEPFIVILSSSADSADVVACTIDRFQGRLSSTRGDTLHFREITTLGFVGEPDGRCAVRTVGFDVRVAESAPEVGVAYIDANRTVGTTFVAGALLLMLFLFLVRDGIG